MKKTLLSVVVTFFLFSFLQAQTIWNGPTITFTKAGGADWTLPSNQDRITSSTWITRANIEGIFNIAQEADYNKTLHNSPVNTEWASGTLANYATLTYSPWRTWAANSPPSTIGVPAVVHLISENIYIGITFTGWGGSVSGGSFSYQRTTAPITSPVKLIDFRAVKKNSGLLLNWLTSVEENTSHFSIERSSDGKEFTSIGKVQASGNTTEQKEYFFTDGNPLPSNFYRLRSVDNNGSFTYSKIVAFKVGKVKSLELFPVPATSHLNIQLNASSSTTLEIVDVAGMIRKTKIVPQGPNAFNVELEELQAGVYFLRVDNESRMFIKK